MMRVSFLLVLGVLMSAPAYADEGLGGQVLCVVRTPFRIIARVLGAPKAPHCFEAAAKQVASSQEGQKPAPEAKTEPLAKSDTLSAQLAPEYAQ